MFLRIVLQLNFSDFLFLTSRIKMKSFFYIRIFIFSGILVLVSLAVYAQPKLQDSTDILRVQKQENFYHELGNKAKNKRIFNWLYDAMISTPVTPADKKILSYNYFKRHKGKTITKISIKPLDVFGPTITDTSQQAANWLEKTANRIHTKSNLKTIRKQLLFKVGDTVEPEFLAENERFLRQISYLQDVRFLIEQDSLISNSVNIIVLTKDRFSFGVSGAVNGTNSGAIRVYDKNIFGIGHEISMKFVGHLKKEPYLGIETHYQANNIAGKFINLELGYLNTYLHEGYILDIEKPFITYKTKWGYGAQLNRFLKTKKISSNSPVALKDPVSEWYSDIWGGRSINIEKHNTYTQLTFLTGMRNYTFFDRSKVPEESKRFFADQTLYMAGIVLSRRNYNQDQLIYSYGITEDIPKGFKHEILYGYDTNEFGDRHFFQFFASTGNKIGEQKGYYYSSVGFCGYLKNNRFEEGMVEGNFNFISKLRPAKRCNVRSFVNLRYTLGIRRFEIESLSLKDDDLVRGFGSESATGKQRLTLKLEHVVFLPRQFYKFNMAVFGFADLGIIGSNNKFIFNEKYYPGLGIGIRLHNENLVFETFRFRFAIYPFHPGDMTWHNFVLDEQNKQQFESFEPTQPDPMVFE